MVEREKSGADRKGWLKSGRAGWRWGGWGGEGDTAEEEMERKKQGDTLKLKWLESTVQ